MNFAKRKLGLAICALFAVFPSACGNPGPPVPPSLELARPVRDLHATRKGDTVTLTWTAPTRTTDGHNIRHWGKTEVCRATEKVTACDTPIAELPPDKISEDEKGSRTKTYTDNVAALEAHGTADSVIVYAVNVLNSYGRSAGLSNRVEVPAAPTLAAPQDVRAQLSEEGVTLTWESVSPPSQTSGIEFLYRVYRQEISGERTVIAGEVPLGSETSPRFLDRGIEWEKGYRYWATVVTVLPGTAGNEQEVDGADSPEVTIFAHDIFPPATPAGLQAVFSGPGQKLFIDLVWGPDTDADLAGYNVYRQEAGTEALKLNSELVRSPAFRDTSIVSGHKYTYSVSAIDVRGNESPRSEPASEKVPQQ